MNTVYKSIDGGKSWKNLNNGNLGNNSGTIKGMAISPYNSKIFYISGLKGVFKSTNGGKTWSNIGENLPYKLTACICVSSDGKTIYVPTLGGGVYTGKVFSNGEIVWDKSSSLSVSIYNIQVAVDLVNPKTIFASAYPGGLFKNTDEGKHWRDFSRGLITRQIRTLAISTNGKLLCGNLGYGLYWYNPEENRWEQLNAFDNFGTLWPIWDNRPLYQYTSLLFHPKNHNIIYIGTFPAGIYKSTDRGKTWYERNVGWTNEGVFTLVFHPRNPKVIYAGTYNGLNISTYGGAHWKMWDNGWPGEQ